MICHILGGTIITKHPRDLKHHFRGFLDIFSTISKFRFSDFPKNGSGFFCLTTLMVRNFFLVTEHLWKTSEMEFSDRVDMVLKKSHGKILFFRKVTTF